MPGVSILDQNADIDFGAKEGSSSQSHDGEDDKNESKLIKTDDLDKQDSDGMERASTPGFNQRV